jgi:hypothetical protein
MFFTIISVDVPVPAWLTSSLGLEAWEVSRWEVGGGAPPPPTPTFSGETPHPPPQVDRRAPSSEIVVTETSAGLL